MKKLEGRKRESFDWRWKFLSWDVPYEPGILKAVGKKDGEIVSVEEIITSGSPAKIELIPDRTGITADGRDVCNITVKITDEKGNFVPTADNLVTFEIKGEGRLIGVDNGRQDSHEDFQINYRKAFNGLCLAVIQSTFSEGEITVTAKAEGLEGCSVAVNTQA